MKEIDDNEIRIIGKPTPRSGSWYVRLAWVLVCVVVVVAALVLWIKTGGSFEVREGSACDSGVRELPAREGSPADESVIVIDTVVDDVPLTLYMLDCLLPDCSRASLQLGLPAADSSLLLAVMAADVRADNGDIVGDFVIDGRQLARGERKEGYCAILDGVPLLGRGGKPFLQQALDEEGCFFRQYVLVDEGKALPPKPKGKNHRRALCRMGHTLFVAASVDRESYHDFATALADLWVDEAVALVGSESLLIYRAEGGLLHTVGSAFDSPNANFLVWRR